MIKSATKDIIALLELTSDTTNALNINVYGSTAPENYLLNHVNVNAARPFFSPKLDGADTELLDFTINVFVNFDDGEDKLNDYHDKVINLLNNKTLTIGQSNYCIRFLTSTLLPQNGIYRQRSLDFRAD
jgi:hypothetical protein